MRQVLAASLFLLTNAVASVAQTEAASAIAGSFQPERLTVSTDWKGPQFVQAGQDGQAVLLRAQTYEVYPLEGGTMGSPLRLERLAQRVSLGAGFLLDGADQSAVLGAAMSPAGDWLVLEAFEPRLFRGGEEVPIDSPGWWVLSVGWLGDEPVIGGTPRAVVAAMALQRELPGSVPFLAQWDGDRWVPLVVSDVKNRHEQNPSRFDEGRNVQLSGSRDGRLWVAFDDQHRFRKYSAGGRLLAEIVVAGGVALPAEDAERRQKGLNQHAAELTKALARPVFVFETLTRRVSRAVAEATDGRVYFLVEGDTGITLERFVPGGTTIERLPLRIPSPGRATMAAADDGLYIAAVEAKRGLWRLPWEGLETADWEPVGNAEVYALDSLSLDGAWREKNGSGLVRFDDARVLTFEDDRLVVRGLVSLNGNQALLRRSGFGETWKIWQQGKTLRVERSGTAREYVRLERVPPEVSLAPAKVGEAIELTHERTKKIAAGIGRRYAKLLAAQGARDANEERAVLVDALRYLQATAKELGWIDARRFGFATASEAAFLARFVDDLSLRLAALPVIERDFKATAEGAPVFASFYDALQISLGGKQRYGTQIAADRRGDPVVLPLDRRAEVDAARGKLGLPTLADYLGQVSREAYQGRAIQIAQGDVVPSLDPGTGG